MPGNISDLQTIFAIRAGGEVHPLTLSEQIAEAVYRAIVEGEYQLGERIREEELSRRFQVSRGPVREALRILEKDSVVVILPHRGAHVTELTAQEVRDIFAIRKALIGLAICGFDTLPEAVLDEIDAQTKYMTEIAQAPDSADEYARSSARLHLFLASQSENQRLVEMIRSLARQTFRYTLVALSDSAARARSAEVWRDIARNLRAGRMRHAADLAQELIERSCAAASATLSDSSSTD